VGVRGTEISRHKADVAGFTSIKTIAFVFFVFLLAVLELGE